MRKFTGDPNYSRLMLHTDGLRERIEELRSFPNPGKAVDEAHYLEKELDQCLTELRRMEGKAPLTGRWGGA